MNAPITRLGKYDLVRALGEGAMGVVYEAVDSVIERTVAIKTIRKDDLDAEEAAEHGRRFLIEAKAAGKLNHPNIVGLYDHGDEAGLAYIVMELVQGRELQHYFNERYAFSLGDIVRLMGELLDALGYSHRRGVIHRDVKPANIFITEEGHVKLGDFGIARIESTQKTRVGTALGTPSHMAPEQIRGDVADARSDLYAAGVVLYQFLTGERPFTGTMLTMALKVLNEPAPAPSSIRPGLPAALDAVVARALAKQPGERYQSAAEFWRALADASGLAASGPPSAMHQAPDGGAERVFARSSFGDTGFGRSGFGDTGFGRSGFGDTGVGRVGVDEAAPARGDGTQNRVDPARQAAVRDDSAATLRPRQGPAAATAATAAPTAAPVIPSAPAQPPPAASVTAPAAPIQRRLPPAPSPAEVRPAVVSDTLASTRSTVPWMLLGGAVLVTALAVTWWALRPSASPATPARGSDRPLDRDPGTPLPEPRISPPAGPAPAPAPVPLPSPSPAPVGVPAPPATPPASPSVVVTPPALPRAEPSPPPAAASTPGARPSSATPPPKPPARVVREARPTPPRPAAEAPAPPQAKAPRPARCSDILQKASLEPLTSEEAAYLRRECQ